MNNNGYGWPEVGEPGVSIDVSDKFTNPKMNRFEGKTWPDDPSTIQTNCRIAMQMDHLKNPALAFQGGEVEASCGDKNDGRVPGFCDFKYDENTHGLVWVPWQTFEYKVDWDNNQGNCEIIGGDCRL